MLEPIYKGKPINPLELQEDIRNLFILLRKKVRNFIPIGGGLPVLLQASKFFNTRPQVLNTNYSSITKNNTSQTEKTVEWLGTPLTLDLLTKLNVIKKYSADSETSAGEVFASFYQLDSKTNDYKKEDVYPLNPTSDKLVDGIPLKANSPFIYNSYFGFSNFVEDTNIRFLPSQDGSTLNIKARRLSLLVWPQNTTDFLVTNDLFRGEQDRKQIESIELNSIDITINSRTQFSVSPLTPGHYPTVQSGKDFGVWVVYNSQTQQQSALLTDWSNPYPSLNGVVRIPNSGWLSGSTINYIYYRCVACVHINSDGKFEVSKKLAWGDISTTPNGDYAYTEIYQQNSEANFTLQNSTTPEDRRIVPSYYYLYQINPSFYSLVNYSGIIKHIPGAGGNQVEVTIDSPIQNSTPTCVVKIESLEVTDSKESIWISDINLNLSSLNPQTNNGQTEIDTGTFTNGESYYVWFIVNPYSILDRSPTAPKKNLRMKLLITKSDNWREINSAWKAANPGYIFRSRLFWINTKSNGEIKPFYMRDGFYRFLNLPGAVNSSGGVVYEFSDLGVLVSGSTSISSYALLVPNTRLPMNSNNTYLNAKHIAGRLAITTGPASTSESRLGISASNYGATISGVPNWSSPYIVGSGAVVGSLQSYKNGTSIRTNIQTRYSMYLNPDSQILYAVDLGADSSTSGTKWFITLDEMTLPINSGFCYY